MIQYVWIFWLKYQIGGYVYLFIYLFYRQVYITDVFIPFFKGLDFMPSWKRAPSYFRLIVVDGSRIEFSSWVNYSFNALDSVQSNGDSETKHQCALKRAAQVCFRRISLQFMYKMLFSHEKSPLKCQVKTLEWYWRKCTHT